MDFFHELSSLLLLANLTVMRVSFDSPDFVFFSTALAGVFIVVLFEVGPPVWGFGAKRLGMGASSIIYVIW